MNIKELNPAITEARLKYGDDLEVYIEADHGQDVENAFFAGVVDAVSENGEVYIIHEDDLDEYESNEIIKIFLIQG